MTIIHLTMEELTVIIFGSFFAFVVGKEYPVWIYTIGFIKR